MSRWAAVHNPDGMIWEIREGDSTPEFVPFDCQWIDASEWGYENAELICTAARWDGSNLIVPPATKPA